MLVLSSGYAGKLSELQLGASHAAAAIAFAAAATKTQTQTLPGKKYHRHIEWESVLYLILPPSCSCSRGLCTMPDADGGVLQAPPDNLAAIPSFHEGCRRQRERRTYDVNFAVALTGLWPQIHGRPCQPQNAYWKQRLSSYLAERSSLLHETAGSCNHLWCILSDGPAPAQLCASHGRHGTLKIICSLTATAFHRVTHSAIWH